MSYKLPPLNALRVAEVAGRQGSFTRAAEELHVTPGAISRQIKLLEEILGIDIFERNSQGLRLPPESQRYIKDLTEGFEKLASATRHFVHSQGAQPLHVHCTMTFALRWLVPRLASFHATFPKRNVRLTTANMPVEVQVETGDIDIIISLGDGNWPSLDSHRLVDSELVPACSPKLAASFDRAKGIGELAQQTLLHSLAVPNDWENWQKIANVDGLDPYGGLRFESSTLAYQAAVEGIGVAIAQRCMIEDDIQFGRLVVPFDVPHKDGKAYYLIHTPTTARESRLVEFRDWLLSQSNRDRHRV